MGKPVCLITATKLNASPIHLLWQISKLLTGERDIACMSVCGWVYGMYGCMYVCMCVCVCLREKNQAGNHIHKEKAKRKSHTQKIRPLKTPRLVHLSALTKSSPSLPWVKFVLARPWGCLTVSCCSGWLLAHPGTSLRDQPRQRVCLQPQSASSSSLLVDRGRAGLELQLPFLYCSLPPLYSSSLSLSPSFFPFLSYRCLISPPSLLYLLHKKNCFPSSPPLPSLPFLPTYLATSFFVSFILHL